MSTSFYANHTVDGRTAQIHLGLTAGGYATTLSGLVFGSWADMKAFLLQGEKVGLTVKDEYERPVEVEAFIERIESSTPHARGRAWRSSATGLPHAETQTPGAKWLDAEGFSLLGVEFF